MQHEKFQSAPGSRVGTPAYLAPEVIMTTKGQTYDGKVQCVGLCKPQECKLLVRIRIVPEASCAATFPLLAHATPVTQASSDARRCGPDMHCAARSL